jgi:hypothetical protein
MKILLVDFRSPRKAAVKAIEPGSDERDDFCSVLKLAEALQVFHALIADGCVVENKPAKTAHHGQRAEPGAADLSMIQLERFQPGQALQVFEPDVCDRRLRKEEVFERGEVRDLLQAGVRDLGSEQR